MEKYQGQEWKKESQLYSLNRNYSPGSKIKLALLPLFETLTLYVLVDTHPSLFRRGRSLLYHDCVLYHMTATSG